MTDSYKETSLTLITHGPDECSGAYCCIHNPSDHPLKDAKLNWRDDRAIMERVCEHGVGHDDPDDLAHRRLMGREASGVHGCDGCCLPPLTVHQEIQLSAPYSGGWIKVGDQVLHGSGKPEPVLTPKVWAKVRDLLAIPEHPDQRLARAYSTIAEIRELHSPFRVWDECDCSWDVEGEGADDGYHTEVHDIGTTCNYQYSVCTVCCTDGDYLTEACSYHDHGPDKPICPTTAILDKHDKREAQES